MLTAKITSKGQITIPKRVRDKLGVQAGDGISFEEKEGVFYIKKSIKKSPFDKWVGKLKGRQKQKTDGIISDLRGQ
jgi:AbrB family looped-hinge helix DNA binding protein